jgi:putative endonuclease
MDLSHKSRKEIGNLGEAIAAEYLHRRGMTIVDKNVSKKTGELDLIAREGHTLHMVEVKTVIAEEFPSSAEATEGTAGYQDDYDPSLNLHEYKLRKVARTAEWYVLEKRWQGDFQIDGCLVWLRRRDGLARVRYLPQLL